MKKGFHPIIHILGWSVRLDDDTQALDSARSTNPAKHNVSCGNKGVVKCLGLFQFNIHVQIILFVNLYKFICIIISLLIKCYYPTKLFNYPHRSQSFQIFPLKCSLLHPLRVRFSLCFLQKWNELVFEGVCAKVNRVSIFEWVGVWVNYSLSEMVWVG